MSTAAPPRTHSLDRNEAWLLVTHCRWKELALRRHGFTAERLTRLAQRVASDALRLRGAVLQDRFDDLVSRLVMVGMESAWRYDPEREHLRYGANGGEPFASYVADIMDKRVDDYFRSKAEGFGDRRYGNDNRVVLTDELDVTEATDFWSKDSAGRVTEHERVRWQRAAQAQGQDLDQWMVNACNRVAKQVLEAAA